LVVLLKTHELIAMLALSRLIEASLFQCEQEKNDNVNQ